MDVAGHARQGTAKACGALLEDAEAGGFQTNRAKCQKSSGDNTAHGTERMVHVHVGLNVVELG